MKQSVQKSASVLASATNRVFKTPTLEDVVGHRQTHFKNLFEMLAGYPNQGIGFKVWRKTWHPDKYIVIKQAKFKGLQSGDFFGIEYFAGKPLQEFPIRVSNCNKRGIWRYDCNGTTALTENGLHYSADVIRQAMLQTSLAHKLANQ